MDVPRDDTDTYPEFVADAGPAASRGYVPARVAPASPDMQMYDEADNDDVGPGGDQRAASSSMVDMSIPNEEDTR